MQVNTPRYGPGAVAHRLRRTRRDVRDWPHISRNKLPTFAFGSNGAGQLGLGHREDVSSPEQSNALSTIHGPQDEEWFEIVGGGNHTVLRTGNSLVGSCTIIGAELPAELPLVQSSRHQDHEHYKSRLINMIRHVAVTWDAFAITRGADPNLVGMDTDMIIETFGSFEKGQLGRPRRMGPQPCMNNHNIICQVPAVVSLAGGVQHFVAVLKTGDVIGWGNGRKGQLGEPVEAIVDKPRVIEGIDFKVVRAVCGREFTLLLGDPAEGRLLILGSDKFGIKSDAPKIVKNWVEVGAGWGTITILLEDGKLMSWGRNDHGQHAPKALPPIRTMAVGSEHTVALSHAGEVLAWGWGEHGNCGKDVDEQGDVKDRWNVIPVPENSYDNNVIGVGAGCATSFFWIGERVPGAEQDDD